jgi:hypothetical protein
MKITIEVPESCLATMQECGYSKRTCELMFKRFMKNILEHPYGHLENDFEEWLESLEESDIEEIKKGKEV